MAYKTKWLKILIIVLVFGMFGIGNLYSQNLNGKWTSEEEDLTLNNGNYEALYSGIGFWDKGTYRTNNNKITFIVTHIHGDFLINEYGYRWIQRIWYTRDELYTLFRRHNNYSLNEINNLLINLFWEDTFDYTIRGNVLTIDYGEELTIYTRE